MDPSDSAAYRVARVRSRLPRGARHEAWSAQLARQLLAAASGLVDPDLVVHLVASHHGHGRPLLPPVVDPDPRRFSVSADGLNTFRE
jgi:CRISPR-associated endonuclease/helicase Cas3